MTKKILERYAAYYRSWYKLNINSFYEEANKLFLVLDTLEEVLLNDCGVTHDKLAEIRYLATKDHPV